MSKYENFMDYEDEPQAPLVDGESLIWSAKPKKNAFIINQILTMMPFALLWLAFDSFFIISFFSASQFSSEILFFIIPFFAFHLMPVWIWISHILTANRKWKNTKYYITDKRIIIQTGLVDMNYQTIYYKDLKNVNLSIGIIDKALGVGDIHFDIGTFIRTKNGTSPVSYSFLDIENPREIYPKLQKIVLDMQTDIEFPNAYRPDENPGYNTKYKG